MVAGPNPRDMIGQVYERGPSTDSASGMRRQTFLGTSFALWHPDYFLTAHHCIEDRRARDVFVYGAFGGVVQPRPVTRVHQHDRADVAVLVCETLTWGTVSPFPAVREYADLLLGEEFYAYGFPVDALTYDQEEGPTPRAFRGHFQRYCIHESSMGYRYRAGEMSMPAPSGLSGGPVFSTEGDLEVFGLVAANLEANRLLHEEDQEIGNDERVKRQRYRVIAYGMSVLLDPIVNWLRTVIPPPGR